MAVKYLFAASRKALLRLLFCIALCCPPSLAELYAQDDSSNTEEKHIYDTSESFFNKKIYADDAYFSNPVKTNKESEHALSDLKKDKAFWYVDAIEKLQEKKAVYRKLFDSLSRSKQPPPDQFMLDEEESFVDSPIARSLLWILIIGILLFALIYFLAANKLSLFARRDILSQANNDADGPAVNIFESHFDEMLLKAAAEKNFRLMTRILYLQTLRLLSDKNMIRYNPSYTNLEYLHQMHPTDHYRDFFTITRHYEYVWYGKFELTEPVFRQVENAIRSFHKRIG